VHLLPNLATQKKKLIYKQKKYIYIFSNYTTGWFTMGWLWYEPET